MKNKKSQSSFIPARNTGGISIDDYLNEYFSKEDKRQLKAENFFKQYYGYLESEREKNIDDITESLEEFATDSVNLELCRIVDLEFANNPLNSVGSIRDSGQRFNIGVGLPQYRHFPCLYLADNDDTAYAEKFHTLRAYTRGGLNSENMAARKAGNYASFSANVSLQKCINIKNKENLKRFCEVISTIRPTRELLKWGNEIGIFKLKTIQTSGELQKSLLDPEFLKLCMAMDIPSNSQWFGYYCLRAGIQAIIYPSVRNISGTNYAVLIENFKDTDATVELASKTNIVPETYKKMDATNFEFFKINTNVALMSGSSH